MSALEDIDADRLPFAWLIASERDRQSLSQSELAERLRGLAQAEQTHCGATRQAINRYERGRIVPRADTRRWLAEALGVPIAEVAAAAEAQTRKGSKETDILGSEERERLRHILGHRGRIDSRALEDLEQATTALDGLEPETSPTLLLELVGTHLDQLSRLLGNPMPPSFRTRLCTQIGLASGLAGWLAWDSGRLDASDDCFKRGFAAAREAEDRTLGGWLLGSSLCHPADNTLGGWRRAVKSAHPPVDPADRLARLSGAISHAGPGADPATLAYLHSLEAEAYAMLADRYPALRRLDRAEMMLSGAAYQDRPLIPDFISDRWLFRERGWCLARLNQPDQAETEFRQALSFHSGTEIRTKGFYWLLADLAGTYVQRRAPEEACRLAIEILDGRMGAVPSLVNSVRDLRRELEPYRGNIALKDLDDRIEATGR